MYEPPQTALVAQELYPPLPESAAITVSNTQEGRTATVGLLNRPQRKPLSRTESGILKVNKINSAIVTSTDERFVLSKGKGGE